MMSLVCSTLTKLLMSPLRSHAGHVLASNTRGQETHVGADSLRLCLFYNFSLILRAYSWVKG